MRIILKDGLASFSVSNFTIQCLWLLWNIYCYHRSLRKIPFISFLFCQECSFRGVLSIFKQQIFCASMQMSFSVFINVVNCFIFPLVWLLFYLFFVSFLSCILIPFVSCPFIAALCSYNIIKFKRKKETKTGKINFIMEAVVVNWFF